ncbi:MAG TPA: F0F1 ATP synthase subunit epsilon [Nitrospiraceae bacterium]|nr:MAG: ATP synthase F1 subunit epsilon [Nitrospirae bacterium GWA2_46_11]OGW23944.1 MAG: ATP synthase F1 subunit epsilon [Nitrospirae bacterium GWB2_47_37]HAK89316.1 F0F1 ATP synthase subunit epsilon [Nitrospiraceae bacterium]HCL80886.1 F0F1 ATP synthase subunit epsilon [Nitrospiraceae bacterium]HCZ12130.1 F0F1 ATP synthase subunit epsilon [Nitrospiraceae bacterium]
MENNLKLDIVTPHGLVLSEEVDEVAATGTEGEFGVLPGHVPFITTLRIGMVVLRKGGNTEYVFVSSGYAEVSPDKVVILADSAEKSEGIDVERAKAAMKRAEERLRKAEEIDFARATASLERATIRIQIAESRKPR